MIFLYRYGMDSCHMTHINHYSTDLLLRRKLQHMTTHKATLEKKNEAIKHGSYDRVLQRRRKDAFVKPVGNKINECLC
jgi:hypothetical protein